MAKIEDILDLTVTTGGTLNVPVQTNLSLGSFNGGKVRVSGTSTLVGALNIAAQGTPALDTTVELYWGANVTNAGNAVSIFGATVPSNLTDKDFNAICEYYGTKWSVNIVPSFDENGIVTKDRMADDSVGTDELVDGETTLAKIQDVAANSMLIRDANSSGVLTELALATTEFPVGTGTGINAVSMSGDATMSNTGVVTIGSKVVEGGMVADDTITNLNLEDNANRYTRDITLSFQSSTEVGNVNFTMCEDCTVEQINVTVLDPATTDTATLIYKDNGGTVLTGSQTDITTGLVLGNIVSTTPTANNTFSRGDNLLIEMSKTTKTSCKVNVAICLIKT